MNTVIILEKLTRLEPLEQLGKQYQQRFGKALSYSQFLVLREVSRFRVPTLNEIRSPAFEAKCRTLEQEYASQYRQSGLRAQDFIRADRNIEMEKLFRYVHIPAHRHDFVELVFVFSGTCTHTVEGQSFQQGAGSFTIVNSFTSHELVAAPDCLCLTTKVRMDTFREFHIPNLPLLAVPVCFDCGDDAFMRDMLLTIYEQQTKEACYHDEIVSLLLQSVLIYCMQNFRDTVKFLYAGTRLEGRMLEIMNYMFENYQNVTLRGLAHHFGYSEPYLCKLFREEAGSTFTQILRDFKLKQAKKLLQTTDKKLNEICDTIGYSDTTQFIRDFKQQYGNTPAKYRKAFQENP